MKPFEAEAEADAAGGRTFADLGACACIGVTADALGISRKSL